MYSHGGLDRCSGCTLEFPSAELFPLHNFQKADCRCQWAYSFGVGEVWWMGKSCSWKQMTFVCLLCNETRSLQPLLNQICCSGPLVRGISSSLDTSTYFTISLFTQLFTQLLQTWNTACIHMIIYILNQPAAQAAGADASRWSSTSRQNHPIQKNRRNFWTNSSILMHFKIYNFWKNVNIVCFFNWSVWTWRRRKYIFTNHHWMNEFINQLMTEVW